MNVFYFCLGIVCLIYLFATGKDAPEKVHCGPTEVTDRPATDGEFNPLYGDQFTRDQILYGEDESDVPGHHNHALSNDTAEPNSEA